MNNLQSWIYTAVVVAGAVGLLSYFHTRILAERARIATEKVSTKNKILDFALSIADQIVITAEKMGGSGDEQKKNAVKLTQERLAENNYSGKFTDEQLGQILQAAYIGKKSDGSIDLAKNSKEEVK